MLSLSFIHLPSSLPSTRSLNLWTRGKLKLEPSPDRSRGEATVSSLQQLLLPVYVQFTTCVSLAVVLSTTLSTTISPTLTSIPGSFPSADNIANLSLKQPSVSLKFLPGHFDGAQFDSLHLSHHFFLMAVPILFNPTTSPKRGDL